MSFTWDQSQIYAGTTRKVTVYIPKQYDGSSPAALMVFQDGSSYVSNTKFKTPIVLDNLIAKKQVPVIVGIFIDPGIFTATMKSNRSVEYDTLSDKYVRFVQEEILPQVKTRYGLNISDDPEQRAAVGLSSGGICAFTMAWQRPTQFHRVMTHSGSFTNIRGGNKYPAMITASAVKPLRVFLNSGAMDLNNTAGSWPMANQAMFDALTAKGYHVRYVFGDGGHVGTQAGTTLPETMSWLWR
jgi:enterochelin esterase family protein